MSKMVLLKCDIGSRAATVLCPECGRISRQILLLPYYHDVEARLIRPHTCPVCNTIFECCTPNQAGNWLAAFERYNRNADAYNQSIKIDYASKRDALVHSMTSVLSSAAQIAPEKTAEKKFFYCSIDIKGVNFPLFYISDQGSIDRGTVVVVPYGRENEPRIGTVRVCSAFAGNAVPHPVDQTKHIIRIASNADLQEFDPTPPLFTENSGTPTNNQASQRITEQSLSREASADLPEPKESSFSDTTSSESGRDTVPETAAVGETEAAIDRKIERWKKELLDTGKRNKMINFRETSRSTLRILEPDATELFNKLAIAEKTLTFQKPINKDTDLRTYSMIALMETLSYSLNVQVGDIKTAGTIIEREKTLKNLRSKAKLAQEEQGTNILYLCFGFIYWREKERSSQWNKSPLLMMPVSLGLKSLSSPYTLSRYDDDIQVNPTLEYLFSTEYHINLPPFEAKNRQSIEEYFSQVEEVVDKHGWKLTREVCLGLVSFLKISMYHDLNNNQLMLANHPVIRAMAGDRNAIGELPARANQFDFDSVKPGEWHEVVDADSSQEEAILLSKLGVSFVMQGPPGTGKSQTITNIIAEALADGKKVLFVSEKAAALEVVLKRLTEVHLDDFCLSLHNYKANKKEIIDSIGANLSLEPDATDRAALNELTELFHDREFLTKYADELHQVIEPLGESVYMVFGKLSKLEKASAISFHFDDPKSITREQYSSLLYVLSALERALHNLGGTLDSNVWHGTTAKSSGQTFKQQLIQETAGLSIKLRELDEKVTAINDEYSTKIGHSWESVEKSITDVEAALDLPLFPYWWSELAKRDTLLSSVRREASAHRSLAASMQNCRGYYHDSILDAPLDDWIKRAGEILDSYKAIGYGAETAGDNYLTDACQNADKVEGLLFDLGEFAAQYSAVADKLGLSKTGSFQDANRANVVFEYLKARPDFREKVWFYSAENKAAIELVDAAQDHANRLHKAQNALEAVWSDGVRSLDLAEMRKALFESCAWLYSDSANPESMADQLSTHLKSAQEVLDKTTSLVNAHSRAIEVLGVERADTLDGLRSVAALLMQASEVPYLETAWFDVRKNAAAQPLLYDAYAHYTRIQALTASILEKWEPEALNMEEEALAMLARFKTEHVGVFHRMKSGYKEDVKRIRLLSKEVGKSVDEAEAVAFLQALKELHDEKQWYSNNRDLLTEMAGSYYRGASTDWETVRSGMLVAAEIANSFPYSNIPQDVISAIQRSGSSIQSAAEIKALAEVLCAERIDDCNTLLKSVCFIEYSETETSIKEVVIPAIQRFQQQCSLQQEMISTLQTYCRLTNGITAPEVRALFWNANQLQIEETWFSENKSRLDELFGNRNNGPESNFDEIRKGLFFGKAALAFFSGSLPEELIAVLSSEENTDRIISGNDMLTQTAVDRMSEGVRLLAPYALSEDASVSEYILPRVSAWHSTTKRLASLEAELRPYLVSEEIGLEQAVSSLPMAIQSRNLRDQIIRQETGLATQLGDRYQGVATDWASIESDIETYSNYTKTPRTAVSQEFLEIICDSEELRSEARRLLNELKSAHEEAAEPYEAFAKYFEQTEKIGSVELSALSDRYDRCVDGFSELNKWLDYVEARAECDAKGLASFTAAIAQKNNTISDVCNAFERGFYLQWLSAVINEVPAVQSFRRRVHEQRSERFVKLDKKQYEIARNRIRERIIKGYPNTNAMMRAGSDLRILTHEMEKKRRIMPLRKLFKSIPRLLLTLKPCLMMSPLSVAYFLEANAYQFDMVIFDEASQIFPQDAIGAIIRAKQVIIAGDTKQLPPTNFFAANTSNSSEGYDDDEGYDEEVYDSILEETTNVLPNRTLRWHYRSKHEHLIAFSNQEIYRNNLITFPSSIESEPDTGVEFVYVSDGYYEPSPKNYNLLEAQRCVQLVREHIEKHPDRSLGIIAFSEKQQQAIALEIQKFREKNPEYEDFFVEGKDGEFFVKNLENVQGDERDTIFFSVGYARTKAQIAKGKPMAMRFGPLGVQGGERRLNVAITRAKTNVKLISSILPSDIDLNRTESEGVKLLRSYIEFAMNSEATLSAAHKVSRTDDFADAIAQYIRDHGFKVRQYVGCSGYKIDIAVQHPSELIEQFVAGVECDGFSYGSARTTRDRDRLRSAVLKSMGWNLYRVWSAEWYNNPEIEGQKLITFLRRAIESCDVKINRLEAQRQKEEEAKRQELERARAEREAEEARKQREQEAKEAQLKAEREEAERKRREEAAKRDAKKKEEQEARRRREQDSSRDNLSWVKPGVTVRHNSFGNGIVLAIQKDIIRVKFGQTERMLSYPDVFERGILTKPDNAVAKPKPIEAGPAWAVVGAAVLHKTYGDGTIVKISDGRMDIRFGKDTKTFVYPKAITDGHISQAPKNASPAETGEQLSFFGDNRAAFTAYLRAQGYAGTTITSMISAISRLGKFAIELGVAKDSIYSINDFAALKRLWGRLEHDKKYVTFNASQNGRFTNAMRNYLAFMEARSAGAKA